MTNDRTLATAIPAEILVQKFEELQSATFCSTIRFFYWLGFTVSALSLTFLTFDKLASFRRPLTYAGVWKKPVAVAFVITLLVAFGYVDLLYVACASRELPKNVQIPCLFMEFPYRICRRHVRLSSKYLMLIASW